MWYNPYHGILNKQTKKRNGLLVHATWMNLSQRYYAEWKKSEAKKITYCMIPFTGHIQKDKIKEREKRSQVLGVRDGGIV